MGKTNNANCFTLNSPYLMFRLHSTLQSKDHNNVTAIFKHIRFHLHLRGTFTNHAKYKKKLFFSIIDQLPLICNESRKQPSSSSHLTGKLPRWRQTGSDCCQIHLVQNPAVAAGFPGIHWELCSSKMRTGRQWSLAKKNKQNMQFRSVCGVEVAVMQLAKPTQRTRLACLTVETGKSSNYIPGFAFFWGGEYNFKHVWDWCSWIEVLFSLVCQITRQW